MSNKQSWYVYIVRCSDQTLYTGITTDIDRRVKEHNGVIAGNKGAKYTRNRQPVYLVYSEIFDSRSNASSREFAIKKFSKSTKENLIDIS